MTITNEVSNFKIKLNIFVKRRKKIKGMRKYGGRISEKTEC